jgi:hypothetical protein
MEFAGPVFVNIDGTLVETTGYRHHRCDPEKVVAWVEYLNAMEELKGPDSFEGSSCGVGTTPSRALGQLPQGRLLKLRSREGFALLESRHLEEDR